MKKLFVFSLVLLLFQWCVCSAIVPAMASNRVVNLTITYKTVNFTGTPARGISVNGKIPGPTLHFKEGDHVTINVYNHLKTGISVHWHGLIVPWRMDGVEGITQKPIPPGGVFHYHFTLHQAGTYWYHSHAELQEQEGLYGAIIIDPLHQRLHYNQDFPIVLSDWSNTWANKVYANLKKSGDYYTINMPMQPSLLQFFRDYHQAKTAAAKKRIFDAYLNMQKTRMSVYDLSDVAYDAFLLNGHSNRSPWFARVKVGNIVRLRFIGAGGSTIFRVKIPGTKMQVVQVDGNDVKPYYTSSFMIAPGETRDVLVKIVRNHPYIIYAESIDSLGAAVGALLTQPHQHPNFQAVKPFPRPKPLLMKHSMTMGNMQKHNGKMPINNKNSDDMSSPTQYDKLISVVKTNNPKVPVHIIHMTLGGYMDRYIWFLNGKPFYQAKPIMIKRGQWYRIIFKNHTMMRHPMHIHGHWFIIRNGHGAYDPKLHTIDVPPGKTIVADIHANETGQWFFHCHNLMHMKAGMANIFRYKSLAKKDYENFHYDKGPGWYTATNLDLNGDFFNNSYQGTLNILSGGDFNKLQLYAQDAEIEEGKVTDFNMDFFYWRLISQFWAIKGGLNYVYRPARTPYLQPGIGIEGLMPFFIDTDLRSYYHEGSVKFDLDLGRETQLTHRIFLGTEIEAITATKTVDEDEIGSGLNSLEWTIRPYYQLNSNLALYFQYQYLQYYGKAKDLLAEDDEPTSDHTYSIGFSLLF